MFSVTVTVIPGGSKAVLLETGATVRDAAAEAGYDVAGYDVYVGKAVANAATPVKNGDIITLSQQVKGNK